MDSVRRDADKISGRVSRVLTKVAQLELLQAPGLPFSIPKEFESLPRLTGAALDAVKRCFSSLAQQL